MQLFFVVFNDIQFTLPQISLDKIVITNFEFKFRTNSSILQFVQCIAEELEFALLSTLRNCLYNWLLLPRSSFENILGLEHVSVSKLGHRFQYTFIQKD